MDHVDDLVETYAAIDSVATDIITDKHQIVDLDGKRNKGREALRQLRKSHPDVKEGDAKSWMCFGNTFIKMDTASCVTMLEEELKTYDTEINKLRDGLKPKVAKLQRMEGDAESKGFDLKGMTMDEIMNVRDNNT